jgi:hypothetical protein
VEGLWVAVDGQFMGYRLAVDGLGWAVVGM